MVVRFKRLIAILVATCAALVIGACVVFADAEIQYEFENITNPAMMRNGTRYNYATTNENNKVILSCEEGIKSIYVEFHNLPNELITITNQDTGQLEECNPNFFLHYYENIEDLFGTKPNSVEISFPAGLDIARFYAFSEEEGDFVQKWEPMCEQADLMLISTHADDEQLFFAGLLPYYAIERGYDVQVVYYINHFTTQWGTADYTRPHEQLDGLWTVGITHYPYMSNFRDIYGMLDGREPQAASEAMVENFRYYTNTSREELIGFHVDTIRKFKPLIVVDHDIYGEYGHAAHIMNTLLLFDALEICDDATQYPESANQYGTWMPQKVYIHSYSENQIYMDWDTPYESMGGKTPFQMTQEGFRCHPSQHYANFTNWLYGFENNITRSTEITLYSPNIYGLYYSSVGADTVGGDMFENVMSYAEQAAAAEEEARRQAEEEARRQAEEEARRRAEEEARRQAEEEAAEEARIAKKKKNTRIGIASGSAVLGVGALLLGRKGRKRKK